MIQSLDPVGPGQRLEPIHLQGRGPIIDAEQARALGLRNGQVVQAIIDHSGQAFSVLWPAGRRGGLPTALEAFPLPSQWRWAAGSSQQLVALLMPGGFIQLRPVKTGSFPAAASSASPHTAPSGPASTSSSGTSSAASASVVGGTPRSPQAQATAFPQASTSSGEGAGGASGRYTLGQAFALAQGLLPGAGTVGSPGGSGLPAGASAELLRLLQQAPAWASLMGLLKSLMPGERDGEHASADDSSPPLGPPIGARLTDLLGAALPRMGNLTPAALQQAIARSGLGTEAALMAGVVGLDQDLKVALRRLQRGLPLGSGAAEAVLGRSVDTLERSQVDTLTAQMQGQVLLSLVIPFGDAGPVALRIFRDRAKGEDDPPPFIVDVHSGHSGLGPLWLRTQVAHDKRVSMTMWALRPEVAQQARDQSRALRLNLSQSGLVLSSLEIVAGAPQGHEVAFADMGSGT